MEESATSTAADVLSAVSDAPALVDQVFLANALGMFTSVLFTVLYFPQFVLNLRRHSTEGFSSSAIVIKLLGAAFLAVNAWHTGEALPVVAYGAFNVLQHILFMVQFFVYEKRHNARYLLCITLPAIPYLLVQYAPATVAVSNYFKPLSQIVSTVPQILECRRWQTTAGVSLLSQHLNFLGGLLGLYMCFIIPPKSYLTWLLYINSCGQALALYIAYLVYDTGYCGQRVSVLPLHGEEPAPKDQ